VDAAIVTVGSELVEGLRIDTNTAEIARALAPRGLRVVEALSVGDDVAVLAAALERLTASCGLVVVTGGLGPTHDDITREAASRALQKPLVRDQHLAAWLEPVIARHRDPEAAAQVLVQAELLDGAEVFPATTGTAPGQLVATPLGALALLPGPPSEMRPMLHALVERYPLSRAEPHELGVTGLSESDAQVIAQRVLATHPGVALTVLARPGDVRVLLLDDGAGEQQLAAAAEQVADALGAHCYARDGASLAESLVRAATDRGVTLAIAESCTGGMVASAITDVAGASAVFRGGVVSYHNDAKRDLLGVDPDTLSEHGAVSEAVARQMAEGARKRLGADVAVSITGIAGPDGGSDQKPVGLVWFAVATPSGTTAESRLFAATSRAAVRLRATSSALDLLRREVSRPRP
jgi:nicotinamide-nucleotide amidase